MWFLGASHRCVASVLFCNKRVPGASPRGVGCPKLFISSAKNHYAKCCPLSQKTVATSKIKQMHLRGIQGISTCSPILAKKRGVRPLIDKLDQRYIL